MEAAGGTEEDTERGEDFQGEKCMVVVEVEVIIQDWFITLNTGNKRREIRVAASGNIELL